MKNRPPSKRRTQQRFILALCLTLALLPVSPAGLLAQDNRVQKANYELAARWTTQKVGKLVFDTSVAPHWLELSDRFWYSYETSQGRRFYLVDSVRKTKAPVF